MLTRLAATFALLSFPLLECLPQDSPPMQQEPVLRVEATEVVVDVIVTDRKDRYVPGLTASDFKLFENGLSQTIKSFAPPTLPAGYNEVNSGKEVPNAEARSATRVDDPAAIRPAQTPRLITVMIDLGDLHPESLKRACAAAAKFAEKTMAAGNLIAIYWVDNSLHLGVPFTRDRKRVLEVLENLSARSPSGQFTALDRERSQNELDAMKNDTLAMPTNPGMGAPPPDPLVQARNMMRSWITTQNALQARTVFVALRAMALTYRDLPGRKSVALFSEGFLRALDGGAEMEAVIDAANRSNVAIYVVDAAGMVMGGLDGKDPMSVKRRTYDPQLGPDLGEGPKGRVSGGLGEFDWALTLGSDRYGDLGAIANGTGGLLIKDTNDLGAALDHVQEDAGQCYTLTYSTSNPNFDGAFRKIKVELAKRGYHLRYRQGYWALPPERARMMTPAAAQLLAAVESGQQKPSFTPELNAVLVPASDGHFGVSAAVSMPGKLLRFDKQNDQKVAGFSVLLIAKNTEGKLLAVHERYGDLRLKQKEYKEFSSRTFNLQGNVPVEQLQPVTLQATIRFLDGTLGISAPTSINPGKGRSNLRLTSLVLSTREENTTCDSNSVEPLCVQGVRILLPARREFARSTTLIVYCSVLGVRARPCPKTPSWHFVRL
ncbi:MAG: VWA domain-containing protein [Terriglobia bacterium]